MINILSVDWDFFFPDTQQFDWQMNEERFLYYELIWPIRWTNSGIFDRSIKARRIMHPNPIAHQFWNGLRGRISKWSKLVVVDSHADLKHFLDGLSSSFSIWNFDQHHDCGYGERNHKLNCGNWAQKLQEEKRITKYHQVYPEWRRIEVEPSAPPQWADVSYYGEEIPLPDKFQIVFVCRSSPWTPSWSDNLWIYFIEWFKREIPKAWESKVAIEYSLKKRPFDFRFAIENLKQFKTLKRKGEANALLSD